ncbi:hypothetical protein LSH36_1241g00020 [Paralvinella palmiformis]|uniref:G-protein coupled receptors family 3 profile domain-containing protein n=1 Tax=Paralvinella palmiformis TaxID=53620 RepID=A0AAD9IV37_9ANNE|nr:hypothetical protein LSH36_1241g00020 [Paralvinella palmiformis]
MVRHFNEGIYRRVLAMRRMGSKHKVVAQALGIAQGTVSEVLKRNRETGVPTPRARPGRPRKIKERKDRYLLRLCRNRRTISTNTLRAEWLRFTNILVYRMLVNLRLIRAGYFARRPMKKLFCCKYIERRVSIGHWQHVIFSDESRFLLYRIDCRIRVIRDYKLVLIVAVMLKVDGVVLTAWQLVDPLRRETKDLPPEIDPSGSDVEIIRYIEYCHSDHVTIWMSVIYVYKGLLLIFGCFLAWETRQVSIPALNDSKYIGMSVYNVVIICVTAVPISFIMNDKPDQAYLVISLLIMFCTTITLCLVFVPKKKQKVQELLSELCEDCQIADGMTYTPGHKALASDDECSLLSTSSNTNLWPLETNLRHYTHVTRNAKNSGCSDVIELKEISRPLENIYLDDQRDPDVGVPLINQSHSVQVASPPPYDDVFIKDKNNRGPSQAVRTPSYQGLKFLNDIFSLKETAILSDSEPDQSEAGSTRSLPDEPHIDQNISTHSTPVLTTQSTLVASTSSENMRCQSGSSPSARLELGDWRSMPKRERLLGAPRRIEPYPECFSRGHIKQSSGNIPINGDVGLRSGSEFVERKPSHCDVVQYI